MYSYSREQVAGLVSSVCGKPARVVQGKNYGLAIKDGFIEVQTPSLFYIGHEDVGNIYTLAVRAKHSSILNLRGLAEVTLKGTPLEGNEAVINRVLRFIETFEGLRCELHAAHHYKGAMSLIEPSLKTAIERFARKLNWSQPSLSDKADLFLTLGKAHIHDLIADDYADMRQRPAFNQEPIDIDEYGCYNYDSDEFISHTIIGRYWDIQNAVGQYFCTVEQKKVTRCLAEHSVKSYKQMAREMRELRDTQDLISYSGRLFEEYKKYLDPEEQADTSEALAQMMAGSSTGGFDNSQTQATERPNNGYQPYLKNTNEIDSFDTSDAERIVNKLSEIIKRIKAWQEDSDETHQLKKGELSEESLTDIALGYETIFKRLEAHDYNDDLACAIIIDVSGSMMASMVDCSAKPEDTRLGRAINAALAIKKSLFELGKDVDIYPFESYPLPTIKSRSSQDTRAAAKKIYEESGGGTWASSSVRKAIRDLENKPEKTRLLFLISDGDIGSEDYAEMKDSFIKAKTVEPHLFTINNYTNPHSESIAFSESQRHQVKTADDLPLAFADIVKRKLLNT